MEKIILREEYIKLGQAMNLVESGVEAKIVIVNGEVKVNGETEYQRGKKLRAGDIIEYNGEKVLVSED